MRSQGDLEERVARIEALLDLAIARARTSPVGRKILAMLGLE